MLGFAITLITLALVFYTCGVWTAHLHQRLEARHTLLFALGFVCDSSGTLVMSTLPVASVSAHSLAAILDQVMVITGGIALALMAAHLTWALVVVVKDSSRARQLFHRFSLTVWAIWLVPYFAGAIGAMAR